MRQVDLAEFQHLLRPFFFFWGGGVKFLFYDYGFCLSGCLETDVAALVDGGRVAGEVKLGRMRIQRSQHLHVVVHSNSHSINQFFPSCVAEYSKRTKGVKKHAN
jgi:hypothetical protein